MMSSNCCAVKCRVLTLGTFHGTPWTVTVSTSGSRRPQAATGPMCRISHDIWVHGGPVGIAWLPFKGSHGWHVQKSLGPVSQLFDVSMRVGIVLWYVYLSGE